MLNRSKFNRRKRKRLHLGEYQQFGFNIVVLFKINNTDEQLDKSIDAVESCDAYLAGGGGNINFASFSIAPKRRKGGFSEEERLRIIKKFKEIDIVSEVETGELFNMWNFTEDELNKNEKWLNEIESKMELQINK